jgi:dienelactone hydrolase
MGGSLGGFVTLATAAAEPRLDFAVAWVPLSSPADIDEDTKVAPYMVKGMKQSGLDRETVRRVFWVSTPANYPPALPKGDILIIAGMGDNFVPPDQPLAVWEAWGQPPIYWFAGGHVFNFEMKQAQQVAADFLKEHLQSKRNLAPP